MALFHYQRRKSSVVRIGNILMGGKHPVRIQSMTNTSTMDTEGCIQQSVRIIRAGADLVRLTAQGVREAENLKNIEIGLHQAGYHTPLVADIHFNPKAAEVAAQMVEKVRINPGNFADPVKTFKTFEYTDEEYACELGKIRERFVPLLNICKAHRTAIRIGVNHGSLSDRIMSRYGDTPQGMVESCLEFLRICVAENFADVVISIKASNTFTMVQTVRLLVRKMEEEQMTFPLHLGVTEAGEGEDGRIKSAVGIGALLYEGIGDTIRVSLSEDPEQEIPVAKLLVEYVQRFADQNAEIALLSENTPAPPSSDETPWVISDQTQPANYLPSPTAQPDMFFTPHSEQFQIIDANSPELPDTSSRIILLRAKDNNPYLQKAAIYALRQAGVNNRIILWNTYTDADLSAFQIKAAADCGSFFLDRLADGLMLTNSNFSAETADKCSFDILQASKRRISKTEYISCPSCGRTLFNLQETIKKVKAATAHLTGLKIAIMGCIVNGPGEMADADYGYVGAGAGRISLYKGKSCVLKNIPEENAVVELIKLIEQFS
ncbi:MAG: (E)-4-hydroxy-3-methylbut-2-enyl-diphosphate synthase [Candidatus Symbiothrix sp.]|nr:(E)-4-hydroxy-3-methylbut-2-enyl-diphosphate synthase [Candidatus Symbiothrix sp.]